MSATLATHVHGHVTELVFAAPPHNFATVGLLRLLADALEAAGADPQCRAVVLRSEGKSFCAGAELAASDGFGGTTADPLREFYDQAIRIFAARKPVVAAIQGAAIGAGLGLAVAADFRVAAPEARFAANFVALGFHPGFGLTVTLPRLVGAQRASLLALTARRFKAEDVRDWGLIDAMADAAALRDTALALAAEIAANAPLALLATRASLRCGLVEAVTAALAREHAEQAVLRETADYAEGVSAVFARREARFTGA